MEGYRKAQGFIQLSLPPAAKTYKSGADNTGYLIGQNRDFNSQNFSIRYISLAPLL